ncbi:MAG: glutamine-hydrolyzing GMP synthase [Bacteroidales bacterium]|nr:glutamine-hydrolyzing GMP synthase [Bacteroidales bacterium]MBQ1655466.1 glutamine-hydrolyzing GMP synthase [Bacteroidales bacterium]MBQ1683825.1 glutamine-hydrolyzing GMP synthase [Bacteroidales bacterium]MBQ2161914.1 glutamine-hydrolyzing GMP synthase [Bacteroidales bacterium]MBQ2544601.1 glutamine-hydrolyzing GMP synthase [Bacteroidales bacterium]
MYNGQKIDPKAFVEAQIKEIKEQVGEDVVILGLSGGVDSTVTAMLIHRAIGDKLQCIFVDHGLLRKNEFEDVLEYYKDKGLNVKGVRAADRFFAACAGITDPELKRKAIGKTFIDVFAEEARKVSDAKWLAQGTIWPDIAESHSDKGTIKSHHNVGGLPDDLKFGLVEPLKYLYKYEVREVGAELGLDSYILGRHPFPGPGLGVRCLGELTPEKIAILQEADKIWIDALREAGLYDKVWQAAAIFVPVKTTGVKDGCRTYENVIALRAVNSIDAVTAQIVHLPWELLDKVQNEIITRVKGVNRVVYDISSKPSATIEWE